MVLCIVCQTPCRGRCARCGARLCARYKPASSRAKCVICKQLGTGVIQTVQAIPPYPANTPVATPTTSAGTAAPLVSLSLANQLAWIELRRSQLRTKQARERAYLERRAARGTHTPTDEAYEADSLLENDLLEALLQGGAYLPASSAPSGNYAGDTSMLFPDPGLNAKIQP